MLRSGDHVRVVGTGPDAVAAAALCRNAGALVDHRDAQTTATDVDLLVVDEWTAETAPHVLAARRAGARVTVLAEMLLCATSRPVVAVTGTAGKTTTCHLIAAMLRQAGLAPLITPEGRAANAWPNHAVADAALEPGGWFVAELTSTHLCFMDEWHGPDVAVVTSLWPDHVELHGSFDAYVAAKRRLLRREDRPAVLSSDDAQGRAWLGPVEPSRVIEFSIRRPVDHGVWLDGARIHARWDGHPIDLGALTPGVSWAHPVAVVAASAAALACGAPPEAVSGGLRATAQLPHRMASVGVVNDVRVIDDAMAATPAKAAAAIAQFDPERLVVIVGGLAEVDGRDVHASATELAALTTTCALAALARVVVGFGGGGRRAGALIPHAGIVATLDEALTCAATASRRGDTILLAPMFPMRQHDRARFADAMLTALDA